MGSGTVTYSEARIHPCQALEGDVFFKAPNTHCTVTLTVAVCESVPDRAVITMDVVPRFAEVLL